MTNDYGFAEIGANVKVFPPVTFIRPEAFHVGSHVIFSEYSYLNGGAGLHVGNYIHVSAFVSVIGGGVCVWGDFTGVCAGTRIITGTEDLMGGGLSGGPSIPVQYRSFHRSHVICEKHSFLGTNCVIQPGVTIGEGAVAGSGAVVTRDLEPWGIYLGNPARRVKDRPKERILEMERKLLDASGVAPSDFTAITKALRTK